MPGEKQDLLRRSLALCMKDTFHCDIVRQDCVVALKELDWNGYVIDLIGYCAATQSLYIVEMKDVTWIEPDGIAAAIGEVLIDMAGMREKEAVESIQQYAGLSDKKIANAFFYIALPNFVGGSIEKRLHKTGLSLIGTVRKMLSGWMGLLEVYDLNMPARVVEGFESEFVR